MTILIADYIYTPNGFETSKAIAFEETIVAIDNLETLIEQYPDAKRIRTDPYTVIYPGFINTHVHLEFSANKTSLSYGDFIPWLYSVIEERDQLMQACDNAQMKQATQEMLHSGVTTFGAISSFGLELEVCQETPQRVVLFNELIGSNAQYADMLYGDFKERLEATLQLSPKHRITPAIAIHSPYSVHPILIERAVRLAKEHQLPLSAHFLESAPEREWLEKAQGAFLTFFEKFFQTSTPVNDIDSFLHTFETYPTHFTHATEATKEELIYLKECGHSIAHCPRSNRYLGCRRLPLETLHEIALPYSVATDGLSSNDSLNIFDEFRSALMLHNTLPLQPLANRLIEASTTQASKILKSNGGLLAVGRDADFALVTLPDLPKEKEAIALWTILHTKEASSVYIAGERVV